MIDIVFIHSDPKLVSLYGKKLSTEFSFDSAHDGLVGLRKINEHQPHMVIAGDDLRYLSGLGLLKHIRSHKTLHSIPFLFMSHRPFMVEAMHHGANDWINLSFETQESAMARITNHFSSNRHLIKILKSHV